MSKQLGKKRGGSLQMKLRKKVKEVSDASPSSESDSSRSAPSEEPIIAEFSPESNGGGEPGTSPTATSVGTWNGDSEDSDSSLEEVTCTEKDKPPLDCNDQVLRSGAEKSSLNRAKCIRRLANANLTINNHKGLNPPLTIREVLTIEDSSLEGSTYHKRYGLNQEHSLTSQTLAEDLHLQVKASASHEGLSNLVAAVIEQQDLFDSRSGNATGELAIFTQRCHHTTKTVMGLCQTLLQHMEEAETKKFGLQIIKLTSKKFFFNSKWKFDLLRLGLLYTASDDDLTALTVTELYSAEQSKDSNANTQASSAEQPSKDKSADAQTSKYRSSQILVKAVDPPTEAIEMTRVAVEKLRMWLKHCIDNDIIPDFDGKLKMSFRVAIKSAWLVRPGKFATSYPSDDYKTIPLKGLILWLDDFFETVQSHTHQTLLISDIKLNGIECNLKKNVSLTRGVFNERLNNLRVLFL